MRFIIEENCLGGQVPGSEISVRLCSGSGNRGAVFLDVLGSRLGTGSYPIAWLTNRNGVPYFIVDGARVQAVGLELRVE